MECHIGFRTFYQVIGFQSCLKVICCFFYRQYLLFCDILTGIADCQFFQCGSTSSTSSRSLIVISATSAPFAESSAPDLPAPACGLPLAPECGSRPVSVPAGSPSVARPVLVLLLKSPAAKSGTQHPEVEGIHSSPVENHLSFIFLRIFLIFPYLLSGYPANCFLCPQSSHLYIAVVTNICRILSSSRRSSAAFSACSRSLKCRILSDRCRSSWRLPHRTASFYL